MLNPQEASLEVKKYLKKLKNVIENEATWTFLNSKVLKKTRIDDILCCLEASLPADYKEYAKKKGGRTLKSYAYFLELHASIKGRFLLSNSSYSVRYREAYTLIEAMMKTLDSDINHICQNSTGMF